MPEALSEQELISLPLIDYLPGTLFEYTFRPGGDLEFVDVTGRYRRVRGCSADPADGIHAFEENLNELDYLVGMLTDSLPGDTTLEQFYLTNSRFQYLVDECLRQNHIEARWFSPRMLSWMLFDRVEGGYQVKAALRILNRIPEGKYSTGGGTRIEGAHEWMALIATYCGGDIGKAHALAKAVEARDLMPELDALGYFSLDGKARHQRDVEMWAKQQREQSRAAASNGSSNGSNTSNSQGAPSNTPINKPKVRAIIPEVANEVSLAKTPDESPETKTGQDIPDHPDSVDSPLNEGAEDG